MTQDTRTNTGIGTSSSANTGDLTGSAANDGARIAGSSYHHDHSGPGPEVMAASSLEGETVQNHQGETLGEIEEIMLDVRGGRIAYAVLAVGGFLGMGEKYFAIPWRALTLDTDRKCFLLDVDKDRLKNAPGFDKEHWPSMADQKWAGDVHQYYGTVPYWE
ncbi:MAG TPA: PRC-barrel domain-containing protein [Burkholderiales bacterium]|jgi:sporulation protein YlmC with PRC-barrel domain|nr:PRC-barrel domain-containing protein [Burkholderiales bacterium]